MTRKELILRMVERQPDDVSHDLVLYHLSVMKDIEIGTEQMERGEVIDHDELFAELLAEDAQNPTPVVRTSKTKPGKHSKKHREGRAADGNGVSKAPKKTRRKV
jgi:hypothetical protein